MKHIFIAFIFISTFGYSQNNETIVFDILHKNKSLGTMTATKNINNNVTSYSLKSDITKQVLTIKKVDFNLEVVFENGILTKSDYVLYINGKLKKSSNVLLNNGVYKCKLNGKKTKDITRKIDFTSVVLMFGKPTNFETSFSESRQTFREFYYDSKDSNKVNLGKNKNKLDTYYTYKDNVLQSMFVDDVVDFTMVPIK